MSAPPGAGKGPSWPTNMERATGSGAYTLSGHDLGPPFLGPARNPTGKQRAHEFMFFDGLPLEIFGEIVGNLEPMDVLHLARASKGLRAMLMTQSMTTYWKRARENVEGLPDCPSDLPEPAYANLMFSSHCHKCLAEGRDVLTHLEARVQLCYKCSLEEFKKWKDLPQKIEDALTDFIPATSEPLTASERRQPATVRSVQWRVAARTRFHVTTALTLQEQYVALKTPRSRKKWMEERRSAWNSIEEHAGLCRLYAQGDLLKDREEADLSCRDRQVGVVVLRQELSNLGYEDEFQTCGHFSLAETPTGKAMYQIISAGRKVTVKEWQTMKRPMITYMEEVRVALHRRRQDSDLRDKICLLLTPAYTARALAHPTRATPTPSIQGLALMQAVMTRLQADALDTSTEAARRVIEEIPRLMESYASEIEESLLDLLRQSPVYSGQNINREALFYAMTFFRCSECNDSLPYPQVLAHKCFYRQYYELKKRRSGAGKNRGAVEPVMESDEVTEEKIRRAFRGDRMWVPENRLRLNEAAYHHTLGVLSLLGMAPTTTTQTLRDLNPYVELRCKCFKNSSRASTPRCATRWSEVIQDLTVHRSGDYENALVPLREADLKRVPGYEPRTTEPLVTWRLCALCGWETSDPSSHFANEHGGVVTQAQATVLYENAPSKQFRGRFDTLTLP